MKLELGKDKQQNAVIEWLLSQDDSFLKDSIKKCPDENFASCWNYIVDHARQQASNNCAMVEDTEVYGWAKEYFIDYEVREAQKQAKEEEAKTKLLENRRINVLQDVRNLKETLKDYPEVEEKYKTLLCGYDGELEAKISKEDRMNEISSSLKPIYDEIKGIKESKEVKEEVIEEEQEEESENDKEDENYDLFSFI